MRSNPPWTDKILAKHWTALEKLVGAKWMPVPNTVNVQYEQALKDIEHYRKINEPWARTSVADAERRVAKFKGKKPKGYREYGCGSYGCVMPTGQSGMVIKVTTDQTEASFVAAYLSMPTSNRPIGIVPYHRIIAIRGESRLSRPIFVLWRDEAEYVGKVREWIDEEVHDIQKEYYRKSFKSSINSIGRCLDSARSFREIIRKSKDPVKLIREAELLKDEVWARGSPPNTKEAAPRAAWSMAIFLANADDLRNESMGVHIGKCLLDCFGIGLLLADVHLNNIGMPTGKLADEIGMTPIITDPGHAIALDDRYSGVKVEEI